MGRKRTRTIDDFIYARGLGHWKPPRPDKQLSWEEIEEWQQQSLSIGGTRSQIV